MNIAQQLCFACVQMKPTLEKLRQDPDIDVQFFAQEALDGK